MDLEIPGKISTKTVMVGRLSCFGEKIKNT